MTLSSEATEGHRDFDVAPDPKAGFAGSPEVAQKRRSIELVDWSACWGEADHL
jgi:hypothetical protein